MAPFASTSEKLHYIALTLRRIIKCCLLEAAAFGILYLICCALKTSPNLDAVGMSGVLLLYILHCYVQFQMFKLGMALGKDFKIWGLACLTLACMPAVNYIVVAIVAMQVRKLLEQAGGKPYARGATDAEFTAPEL